MNAQFKHRYIQGRFLRFNTAKMIQLGRLMEIAQAGVAPFPAPWDDAFQPFFLSVRQLFRAASSKSEAMPDGPATESALQRLKDGIRTLGNLIVAHTTSPIPSMKDAALRLKARILPEGLKPITEGQDNLGGWTAVTLHRLNGMHRHLVEALHALPAVQALEAAYAAYQTWAAKAPSGMPKVPAESNQRNLLNVARQHLEDALIDMRSMLRRHPDLREAVQTVIQPLDTMMDREAVRKARALEAKRKMESKEGRKPQKVQTDEARFAYLSTRTPPRKGGLGLQAPGLPVFRTGLFGPKIEVVDIGRYESRARRVPPSEKGVSHDRSSKIALHDGLRLVIMP